MKIIHQLIDYFLQSGELSPIELARLEKKGFWANPAPHNVLHLEHEIGAKFYFLVTGDTFGPLWGTDIYTSDSNLGTAAVHAGLLAPGEKRVLQLTIEKPLTQYPSSSRNGVHAEAWGPWSGAFTLALLS